MLFNSTFTLSPNKPDNIFFKYQQLFILVLYWHKYSQFISREKEASYSKLEKTILKLENQTVIKAYIKRNGEPIYAKLELEEKDQGSNHHLAMILAG